MHIDVGIGPQRSTPSQKGPTISGGNETEKLTVFYRKMRWETSAKPGSISTLTMTMTISLG